MTPQSLHMDLFWSKSQIRLIITSWFTSLMVTSHAQSLTNFNHGSFWWVQKRCLSCGFSTLLPLPILHFIGADDISPTSQVHLNYWRPNLWWWLGGLFGDGATCRTVTEVETPAKSVAASGPGLGFCLRFAFGLALCFRLPLEYIWRGVLENKQNPVHSI